jgi:hypothetical protein
MKVSLPCCRHLQGVTLRHIYDITWQKTVVLTVPVFVRPCLNTVHSIRAREQKWMAALVSVKGWRFCDKQKLGRDSIHNITRSEKKRNTVQSSTGDSMELKIRNVILPKLL